jgi:hypothetical protein
LSCAALEAQFWLSLSFDARASSSRYEVEAQLKLRLKLKLVSLKLSSFQAHEKNSLKKWGFNSVSQLFSNLI